MYSFYEYTCMQCILNQNEMILQSYVFPGTTLIEAIFVPQK